MKNRHVDKKKRYDVQIDRGWKKILHQLQTDLEQPISSLVEHALSNTYGIDKDGKPYEL